MVSLDSGFPTDSSMKHRLGVDFLQQDSTTNYHPSYLPTFLSPCPDRLAVGMDALTTPWGKWNYLYMFPPIPLSPKVLAKITNTRFVRAILVTQDSPTRPWFMSTTQIPSVPLKARLSQVVVDKVVTLPHTSNLRVWKLSARHMKNNSRMTQEF